MYAIARNKAIDIHRQSQKKRTTEIDNATTLDADFRTDTLTNHKELTSILDGLEYKYKEVIEGLFFNGYSQREFSKKTGIPLGTIKTRLRIALRELRKTYVDPIIIILTFSLILGSNG